MDELFAAEEGAESGGVEGSQEAGDKPGGSPGPIFADPSGNPPPATESVASTSPCLNCGHQLQGAYCHRCGQRVQDLDVGFRHLLADWFGGVFGFDARIWRTLKVLFTRPGELTREFWAGRRVRYVSPLRLYLVASLLMFLCLSWTGSGLVQFGSGGSPNSKEGVEGNEDKRRFDLSIGLGGTQEEADADETTSTSPEETPATAESLGETDSEEPSAFEKRLTEIGERLENDPKGFERFLMEALPYGLAILVPFFALELRVLFRRGTHRYIYHLIFSLHIHALSFLLITVGVSLDALFGFEDEGPFGKLITLLMFVFAYLSLRRVYGDGFWKTGLKLFILFVVHCLVLTFSLLGTVGVALWRFS